MSDLNHGYHQSLSYNCIDHAVVAYANAPEFILAAQFFATGRIRVFGETLDGVGDPNPITGHNVSQCFECRGPELEGVTRNHCRFHGCSPDWILARTGVISEIQL